MTMTFDSLMGLFALKARHPIRPTPNGEYSGGILDWPEGPPESPRASHHSTDMSGSLLTKVIEGEIIPRLLMSSRNARHEPDTGMDAVISSEAFARLVLASESEEISEHIDALLDKGITIDWVFQELLAPVARKLGELWEQDYCAFTDVTLGLMRLHRVLHELGQRNLAPQHSAPHCAFFAPVPGEQHIFGVSMQAELFSRAGWETRCDYEPSVASLMQMAQTKRFDVIGFSVSCPDLLDNLSDLIDKTRRVSCNRQVSIMVGGGVFVDNRDLGDRFGNATIVADGVQAVRVAEATVSRIRGMAGAEQVD